MRDCNIKINFPNKILKGAGLSESKYLPAWIYKIKIDIINNSEFKKLVSFNITLANGLTYLGNVSVIGQNNNIINSVKIIKPREDIGNDNVIVFANNIMINEKSLNTLCLDVGLYDKTTINSIENSGEKIQHKSKLPINAHLLVDGEVYSDCVICEALDYAINVNLDEDELGASEVTKVYIDINGSQYDCIRKVYLKCLLDNGLKYIAESCNHEPNNNYQHDNKTVLKWFYDLVNPGEKIKIAFKVRVNELERMPNKKSHKQQLVIGVNSNGINNSTYTQCPDSCKCKINTK